MRSLATTALGLALVAPLGWTQSALPRPAPTPAAAASLFGRSSPKKPKQHKASGILEAYDVATQTLTVRDSKGNPTAYTVSPDVQVWLGPTSVSTNAISLKLGAKATLKYTEADARRTATQVHIAASSTKPKTR